MRLRLLLVCVLGAVACSGSGDNTVALPVDMRGLAGQCPTNGAPAASITVVDDQYQPSAVTVPVCGKVRWTFQAAGKHGVYPWDMNFPASPIMGQGVFEYVFPTAGTYSYGCAIHGRMMPGSVTVR